MWDPWVDDSNIMKVKEEYEWDKVPQLFLLVVNTKCGKSFILCLIL